MGKVVHRCRFYSFNRFVRLLLKEGSYFLCPLFLDVPFWRLLYSPCVFWYAVHLTLIIKSYYFPIYKENRICSDNSSGYFCCRMMANAGGELVIF